MQRLYDLSGEQMMVACSLLVIFYKRVSNCPACPQSSIFLWRFYLSCTQMGKFTQKWEVGDLLALKLWISRPRAPKPFIFFIPWVMNLRWACSDIYTSARQSSLGLSRYEQTSTCYCKDSSVHWGTCRTVSYGTDFWRATSWLIRVIRARKRTFPRIHTVLAATCCTVQSSVSSCTKQVHQQKLELDFALSDWVVSTFLVAASSSKLGQTRLHWD